jgi:adenylate kinase family enzyme
MIEIFYINGKPGSGKDTQANKLLELFPNISIRKSTGDIYRGARSPSGEYGQYYTQIAPYIDEVDHRGGLLPNHIIVHIVRQEMDKDIKNGITKFIFTGFPRTLGQLSEVKKIDYQLASFNHHIHFKISDQIAIDRAKNRRLQCLTSGDTIRTDDQPDVVLRRLKTFHKETKPMLEELDFDERLITIDASGTIEEIATETKKRLNLI